MGVVPATARRLVRRLADPTVPRGGGDRRSLRPRARGGARSTDPRARRPACAIHASAAALRRRGAPDACTQALADTAGRHRRLRRAPDTWRWQRPGPTRTSPRPSRRQPERRTPAARRSRPPSWPSTHSCSQPRAETMLAGASSWQPRCTTGPATTIERPPCSRRARAVAAPATWSATSSHPQGAPAAAALRREATPGSTPTPAPA